MGKLNIVLIEPQIPQNTGNIARTCAATGASLHLVEPMGFKVDDKKLKRAGLDYWYLLDITYYDSTEDFFEKNKGGKFFYFTTKGQKIFTETEFPENCYIVFGREDAGLPEALLKENPETSLRIPMIDEARSLNLSNTVAIATYEILRQWNYPSLLCEGQLTKYTW
ncbi:MAG: tRNA (uridine(34)/cytosine(34)/5-carboxymethylaminomethyluridine(34)-2'-O)-methyltransferase TrmL [Clostridia bacterium]|nr:tRNA (uridine(34)/cytosine(34)/5-carboxymethylaminomethyluridine(34)-2'-O)-methyltransferase TrmL [Clostridia bacterium]MBR2418997.1 tRNA (uridine(34)/cytosine(34)/5-carboxymethylaminomethyluridine(34)-2'-O)-methyltransferase TrmL [Clostridia bacterium]